ncbi:transmembrane protease serine 11D-like isoform X2 [Pyxicephalus adspersus]|uniref:transmembrane protease serine 11D-like isoform X2 n=1 Tax=Pyxicephalus adspersus TaxID=30357 RepID=UPI003B5909BB
MALMSQAVENDGDQQLLHKKSKGTCCRCCKSCCACFIRCTSGLIVLLVIAALVLCLRFFFEFPVIYNGFRNTMHFSEEAVHALMATTPNPSNQNASAETCKMFVGSFKLLNAIYDPQYSNTSSSGFQATAQRIQTLLNKTFINSPLSSSYKNASLFSIRSDPVIAYFQLLFCNNSNTWSGIEDDAVVNILQSYNTSQQNGDVSIDVRSVSVGGLAPCPLFWSPAQPWPWQVTIKLDGTAICTGTLLTAFWVLSSANCLLNRDISLLSVESGSSSETVARIIQHPNFTTAPAYNNFALIHLSNPVWFMSSLTPLCLPQANQVPARGSICMGSSGDLLSGGLGYVISTVASAETCLNQPQNGTIYITPTLTIKQVSQMDTGNALVCMNTADNTSYIQGISPYLSNGSVTSNACLSYTNIGPAIVWVHSYISLD